MEKEEYILKNIDVLVVDDEKHARMLIADILKTCNSTDQIYAAANGKEAAEFFKNHNPDLVITDMLMPDISGIELIEKINASNGSAYVIVISALDDVELVRKAMRAGAYDYLIKPFSVAEFKNVYERALEHIRFIDERKNYMDRLESKIARAEAKQQAAFLNSLSTMIHIQEARDSYTHEHSHNVTKYSVEICKALGLEKSLIYDVKVGATLHDIGKVGVPDIILLKPAGLLPEERHIIHQHPATGRKIIRPLMESYRHVVEFVYHHHERIDGKGYPDGLKAGRIPLLARIAAVADAFDAMTSDRPYRKAMSVEHAIEELCDNAGSQFDPDIVKVFVNNIKALTETSG